MSKLLARKKQRLAEAAAKLEKSAKKTGTAIAEADAGAESAKTSPLEALREKRSNPKPQLDLKHWQQRIEEYRDALSGLNLEDKAGIKAQAVAELKPFINDYLKQESHYPNSAAVWFAIWLWDLNDIESAVNLTLYLIAQDQRTPPQFESDLPTFICDQIYDWANVKLQKHEGAAPYLPQVIAAMEAGKWVVHEIPKGKVYAMAAKHADATGDSAAVVRYAETALKINERAGVKKILEKHQALIQPA